MYYLSACRPHATGIPPEITEAATETAQRTLRSKPKTELLIPQAKNVPKKQFEPSSNPCRPKKNIKSLVVEEFLVSQHIGQQSKRHYVLASSAARSSPQVGEKQKISIVQVAEEMLDGSKPHVVVSELKKVDPFQQALALQAGIARVFRCGLCEMSFQCMHATIVTRNAVEEVRRQLQGLYSRPVTAPSRVEAKQTPGTSERKALPLTSAEVLATAKMRPTSRAATASRGSGDLDLSDAPQTFSGRPVRTGTGLRFAAPIVAARGTSASVDTDAARLAMASLYKQVKICRFCAQFFGVHYGSRFEGNELPAAKRRDVLYRKERAREARRMKKGRISSSELHIPGGQTSATSMKKTLSIYPNQTRAGNQSPTYSHHHSFRLKLPDIAEFDTDSEISPEDEHLNKELLPAEDTESSDEEKSEKSESQTRSSSSASVGADEAGKLPLPPQPDSKGQPVAAQRPVRKAAIGGVSAPHRLSRAVWLRTPGATEVVARYAKETNDRTLLKQVRPPKYFDNADAPRRYWNLWEKRPPEAEKESMEKISDLPDVLSLSPYQSEDEPVAADEKSTKQQHRSEPEHSLPCENFKKLDAVPDQAKEEVDRKWQFVNVILAIGNCHGSNPNVVALPQYTEAVLLSQLSRWGSLVSLRLRDGKTPASSPTSGNQTPSLPPVGSCRIARNSIQLEAAVSSLQNENDVIVVCFVGSASFAKSPSLAFFFGPTQEATTPLSPDRRPKSPLLDQPMHVEVIPLLRKWQERSPVVAVLDVGFPVSLPLSLVGPRCLVVSTGSSSRPLPIGALMLKLARLTVDLGNSQQARVVGVGLVKCLLEYAEDLQEMYRRRKERREEEEKKKNKKPAANSRRQHLPPKKVETDLQVPGKLGDLVVHICPPTQTDFPSFRKDLEQPGGILEVGQPVNPDQPQMVQALSRSLALEDVAAGSYTPLCLRLLGKEPQALDGQAYVILLDIAPASIPTPHTDFGLKIVNSIQREWKCQLKGLDIILTIQGPAAVITPQLADENLQNFITSVANGTLRHLCGVPVSKIGTLEMPFNFDPTFISKGYLAAMRVDTEASSAQDLILLDVEPG